MFIAMIDLSKTCGTATILICYALVMFMIYTWIKIKPKVLIYLSGETNDSSVVTFISLAHWSRLFQHETGFYGIITTRFFMKLTELLLVIFHCIYKLALSSS
jgi:hypothetical protein